MKNLRPSVNRVSVDPLSLFRMRGVFTNFDSFNDSITRPRYLLIIYIRCCRHFVMYTDENDGIKGITGLRVEA